MAVNERNGPLVASFPVEDSDQIMLVTDGGQIIRMPVHDIRIIGRGTQGVTLFDVGAEREGGLGRAAERGRGRGGRRRRGRAGGGLGRVSHFRLH